MRWLFIQVITTDVTRRQSPEVQIGAIPKRAGTVRLPDILLPPSFPTNHPFMCPSLGAYVGSSFSCAYSGYGYNSGLFGATNYEAGLVYGNARVVSVPVKNGNLKAASQTLMVADCRFFSSDTNYDNKKGHYDGGARKRIGLRHSRKANILMVDGHVEPWGVELINTHPITCPWNQVGTGQARLPYDTHVYDYGPYL